MLLMCEFQHRIKEISKPNSETSIENVNLRDMGRDLTNSSKASISTVVTIPITIIIIFIFMI